ncbi:hypothetical protein GCM10020219_072540 [Nonomuraea dietziae]
MWAVASWWIPPPAQARLLALAGEAGPQALALNSSAVYVGVSAGGALGGLLIEGYGPGALPVGAAAAELVALLSFWWASRQSQAAGSAASERTRSGSARRWRPDRA